MSLAWIDKVLAVAVTKCEFKVEEQNKLAIKEHLRGKSVKNLFIPLF